MRSRESADRLSFVKGRPVAAAFMAGFLVLGAGCDDGKTGNHQTEQVSSNSWRGTADDPACAEPGSSNYKDHGCGGKAAGGGSGGAGGAHSAHHQECEVTYYGGAEDNTGLNVHTANGEVFDPNAMTAASPKIPFNTKVKVTYQGKSVTVRVNDRGPAEWTGHCFDLSKAAFGKLADYGQGVILASLDY